MTPEEAALLKEEEERKRKKAILTSLLVGGGLLGGGYLGYKHRGAIKDKALSSQAYLKDWLEARKGGQSVDEYRKGLFGSLDTDDVKEPVTNSVDRVEDLLSGGDINVDPAPVDRGRNLSYNPAMRAGEGLGMVGEDYKDVDVIKGPRKRGLIGDIKADFREANARGQAKADEATERRQSKATIKRTGKDIDKMLELPEEPKAKKRKVGKPSFLENLNTSIFGGRPEVPVKR